MYKNIVCFKTPASKAAVEKIMYFYCVNDILEWISRDRRTVSRKRREMLEHNEK